MKIVDDALLELFRGPGPCEVCGAKCRVREPHHYIARGIGGGSRLDIAINLVALGSSAMFQCQCHRMIHDGKISSDKVLAVIAEREGYEPATLERLLKRIRNAPKGSDLNSLIRDCKP